MSGLKQAVRNTAKIIMFKGVYPLCYKVSSLRPLRKNKVIFAEIRSGTLTDSFRYIYEEIKTRGLDPQVYYVHNNKGGMGYLLRICSELLSSEKAQRSFKHGIPAELLKSGEKVSPTSLSVSRWKN